MPLAKHYRDLTDVYNELREIEGDLDFMKTDYYNMSEYVENTIKKLKKLIPEEDQ